MCAGEWAPDAALSCACARADNRLGEKAGAAIAEALKTNRTVHTLNLSGAWGTRRGCVQWARAAVKSREGRRGSDVMCAAGGGSRGVERSARRRPFGVGTAARKGACGACVAMARVACARGGRGAEASGQSARGGDVCRRW